MASIWTSIEIEIIDWLSDIINWLIEIFYWLSEIIYCFFEIYSIIEWPLDWLIEIRLIDHWIASGELTLRWIPITSHHPIQGHSATGMPLWPLQSQMMWLIGQSCHWTTTMPIQCHFTTWLPLRPLKCHWDQEVQFVISRQANRSLPFIKGSDRLAGLQMNSTKRQ